ncbi:MAG: alpha/beta hydrolase, partial [Rubrobacter sp.]|nr:alpha/beta hydrolase [Rubrobacter sp.]
MSIILIVLFLLILVVVAASFALGRVTYEVDSARDTEFLELDGSWVRYDVIGGGPPVVLVHGWLSSSRIWEALARRLAQRFTVYSLDLTGFGESDKPLSGYGVRNGSRLLYAFCAHFGLTRASVIGHDLGGNMAVKLAADHPDLVGRVVLVSVPADEDQIDLPTPLWLATLPVLGPLFYALGRAVRPVRRMWMRPFVADPDDLTDELVDDAGKSTPAAVGRTLDMSRREISGGRLVRQAKIIKMPMLVVSGEADQIVDPHSVSAWAGSVQRAEICLMDACGHAPMIERPAEFAAQILAFLTGDARYLDQSASP